MNTKVYTNVNELSGFSAKSCPSMPYPSLVLMCAPEYYDVLDVKNPFMAGKVGSVDKKLALTQWEAVRDAFTAAGKTVKLIPPVEGLEDMTFTATTTLAGLASRMERVCIPGRMRYPSRRREVASFEEWFRKEGYEVRPLAQDTAFFEGMGDCRWHPGKRLLWAGYGFRTDPEVVGQLAGLMETPVIRLKLVNERFYHLSTCFCPLTQEAVLIYPPAFDPQSLELIFKIFPVVLAAEEGEAARLLACSAAIVDSRVALVQKGANVCMRHMKAVGLEVVEVDTSEFVKSGGSVSTFSMQYY